ncbi:hypothetical protein C7U92_16575 [Bradyrhizobium sp. WBOS7]|uniref:Uncharacterized protein n=1 Tax=Bradyrhizobium betae TaxID=244734 RepID=A0AAE9N7U2_9BRAD|nr:MULTISPECIES: hypothetical protein [Bradyrhizobium]MDD1570577.1 hypothetical protein [Bradyrhizobium sp. WBOS1]UUO34956.1 hypothetical protein DCK84_10570 [Bradyrhizobium sp. WBOS01]MDD1527423.1 hypothetical protein [Bradyrhizobium sp. WBOS2]MDD1578335.1 hypothetical protein [Bradyrhizobium sp. WBOS7]MDD1601058.1 hypothetical protein [Bradyrhizobium sp. WBOS16]
MPILPDIEFTLDFPEEVTLVRMPPEVDDVLLATAKLRLHNRGLENMDADMTAGEVHRWWIYNSDGELVDEVHDMVINRMEHLELRRGAHHPSEGPESHGVKIHGKKFASEGRYKLTYRYWGAQESRWFQLKIAR